MVEIYLHDTDKKYIGDRKYINCKKYNVFIFF